jgi:hypothetical protein
MALIDHPNPIRGNNWRTMTGYSRPPVLLPHAVMPMASDLRCWKYVEVRAMLGANMHPLPRPTQTPCVRKICQYCVHADAVRVPRTISTAPVVAMRRKCPASVKRSEKGPTKKRKNISIEPIHEMSEGGRWRFST